MVRRLLKITGFLMLMIFIVSTIALTSFESKDIACREIEVNYDTEEIIKVDRDEIVRLVKKADADVLNKTLEQINTEVIEKEIKKHDAIINAEVFKVMAKDTGSFKGILAIKVKHRDPVVRIITNKESYYLDKFGWRIPVSSKYTANVLVTTGELTEKYATNVLLPFVLFLESDEFWSAQIEQVHVQANGELLLTPLVGDHVIEFGSIDNYQVKMRNMKAFYEQVLAGGKWNKYKNISLKYNNQVIAKKR